MSIKKEICQTTLTDERALFHESDLDIIECVFDKGESAIKECRNIHIDTTLFRWKYPIWYSRQISVKNSTFFEMARAGIWYIDDISIEDTVIEAPKCLRRVNHLSMKHVSFSNAVETLWHCNDVDMEDVYVKGDYFALNTDNIRANHLTLVGNYSFDGAKNMEIHNSRLLSRDAFWNTENVTVYDSFISGEYLGWNAKNLTLINCTIESLQGMCYIDNLVMKNCRLINTTLAFEYSTVDAQITGGAKSVLNPSGGTIRADHIDRLIIQKDQVDPKKTTILCDAVEKTIDYIDWKVEG